MNIKNYTSGIAAETTIARIEFKLAAVGATHVNKLFGPSGKVTSLVFGLPYKDRTVSIKLPANVKACFEALWKDYCKHTIRPREEAKARLYDQAERTAWRLMQDWIEVQCSMIIMQQAEQLEVFLPYVWDGEQTCFERMKAGGFKQLAQHNS